MTIGIIGNPEKKGTAPAVHELVRQLEKRGIDFILQDRLKNVQDLAMLDSFLPREEMPGKVDVVFAFGGDGTMLSTARFLAGTEIPLAGFNLGKLGFLAEFPVDDIENMLTEYLDGKCQLVRRTLLHASFETEKDHPDELIAMNDIVIDKRETRLMVRLEVRVNGDYVGTYISDGLILSTPTGSTAYSLSVGGPVVSPDAQVTLIAPIAPHMLTARPIVIRDTSVIEVRPLPDSRDEQSVHVIADGQNHRYLDGSSTIRITRHEATVQLVKRSTHTYFDVLRAKLLWGAQPSLDVRDGVTDRPGNGL